MKINLCGDIIPTIDNQHLFEAGDVDALFHDVLPVLQDADFVIGNLEGALTDKNFPIRKHGPNLKASTKSVLGLKKAGFTHFCLANNHSVDFGPEGLADTIHSLQQEGIGYTGVGDNDTNSRNICYLEKDGIRVAIVDVCEHEYTYAKKNLPGANPFDPYTTMFDIQTAKKNASFVIVVYHGGKESCLYPSPRLLTACQAMVRHGADAVFCQHSHCIGCYEEYLGGKIVYGTGNFCFIQKSYMDDPLWHSGLMIQLELNKDCKLRFIPVVYKDLGIELAKGNQKEQLMQAFGKRSEELLTDAWEEGWNAFCHSMADRYLGTVRKAYAENSTENNRRVFAHYLDCEAHLDVLHTLCQTWHMEK